jgi:hypothetical protein
MEFYTKSKWRGMIAVTRIRKNPFTGEWQKGVREEFSNLVVDSGLDLFALSLTSDNIKTQIKYFALGSDNTAPAAGDTDLASEQFRKPITTYTTGLNVGETVTTGYVAPSEANSGDFTIGEIGWFAGSATIAANSGAMIARVVYNRAKTSGEALQIDRTDTFS